MRSRHDYDLITYTKMTVTCSPVRSSQYHWIFGSKKKGHLHWAYISQDRLRSFNRFNKSKPRRNSKNNNFSVRSPNAILSSLEFCWQSPQPKLHIQLTNNCWIFFKNELNGGYWWLIDIPVTHSFCTVLLVQSSDRLLILLCPDDHLSL